MWMRETSHLSMINWTLSVLIRVWSSMWFTVSPEKNMTTAEWPIQNQKLWPSATIHKSLCISPSPLDLSVHLPMWWNSSQVRSIIWYPPPPAEISTGELVDSAAHTTWRWCSRWQTERMSPCQQCPTFTSHQCGQQWEPAHQQQENQPLPVFLCIITNPEHPQFIQVITFTTTALETWSNSNLQLRSMKDKLTLKMRLTLLLWHPQVHCLVLLHS